MASAHGGWPAAPRLAGRRRRRARRRPGGPRLRGVGFLRSPRPPATRSGWTARRRLLDAAIDRFRADDGGFFDTASDAEALVARPRDPCDNASPSGLSSMVHALVDAHALTGEGRYRPGRRGGARHGRDAGREGAAVRRWSLAAAQTMLDGPLEVAVVGPAGPDRAHSRTSRGSTRAPSSSWRTARATTSRCSPAGRSTAGPRRTSAAASSASARSPTRRNCHSEPVELSTKAEPGRFYDGGMPDANGDPVAGQEPHTGTPMRVMLNRRFEGNREDFRLERRIAYRDREFGEILVPNKLDEFETDLTSVPTLFTWLVPKSVPPAGRPHPRRTDPQQGEVQGLPLDRAREGGHRPDRCRPDLP